MFNKKNNEKLLYYSVNTKLTYLINQTYYNEHHYLWCAPFFDEPQINLKTSNPRNVYDLLKKDVENNNDKSNKIKSIKSGLLKGAVEKYKNKEITNVELAEIKKLIESATLDYYEPLLYIIPDNIETKKVFKDASRMVRKGVFSEEYVVEGLPRNMFHVISY